VNSSLYTDSLNAKAISEMIDDGHNKSIFIYENINIYERLFIERGLKTCTYSRIKEEREVASEVDAALIFIDLLENSIDDFALDIEDITSKKNVIIFFYVIICGHKENEGVIGAFKSSIRVNKAKKIIQKKLNLHKYTTQDILINNNKIQAILPFFLLRRLYKRPWKFSPDLLFNNKLKIVKYVLIKFLPVNLFNDQIIVFRYNG
jgi:hypothetical protein